MTTLGRWFIDRSRGALGFGSPGEHQQILISILGILRVLAFVVGLVGSEALLAAERFSVIHQFSWSEGSSPYGTLLPTNGQLYGTAWRGGALGSGVVFAANAGGTNYRLVKSFGGDLTGLSCPYGGVVSDGVVLYGTSQNGGKYSSGGIFRVNMDGTGYAVLKEFSYCDLPQGTNEDGAWPKTELVLSGSNLFGTTESYGPTHGGTIFKIGTNGTGFALLKSFGETAEDGISPDGTLILNQGTLYGTTMCGGPADAGLVYRINTDGSGYTVLKAFGAVFAQGYNVYTNSEGAVPVGGLVLQGNTLFGTTVAGGTNGGGTIFSVSADGIKFQVMRHLDRPSETVVESGNVFLNSDGLEPYASLLLVGNTLYGTTTRGGSSGSGVLFRINTDGTGFAVLKHFSLLTWADSAWTNGDGAALFGKVVLSGHALYGTAYEGGMAGGGTLYKYNLAPEIVVTDTSFGPSTNGFGFTFVGISGRQAVIEAATNLLTGCWMPLQTNLIGSEASRFLDGLWTNFPIRFYRVRLQGTD